MGHSERLAACVHCGFCLPSCPTYQLWGQEMDSPRGRIHQMKVIGEGRASADGTFTRHIDACLGCMACVAACPSGVEYGALLEVARAQVEAGGRRPVHERIFRALLFAVLPHPWRVRAALVPAHLLSRLTTAWAPLAVARQVSLRNLLRPSSRTKPVEGTPRHRVGMLLGCVQRAALGSVNDATVRVLAAEGCSVTIPSRQGCCGALSRHAGRLDEARRFAQQTIQVFEQANVETVLVNAAGCGSSMKEYPMLFEDDAAWQRRASAFAGRVRDVSEFLASLEPVATRHPLPIAVAYHDACHLAHAQGIRSQPRQLLRSIPGVRIVEVGDGEICCGSAGIYNLVQPRAAWQLGEQKARRLAQLNAHVVASANPGCTFQIAAAGDRIRRPLRVMHPVELLDLSIRGGNLS